MNGASRKRAVSPTTLVNNPRKGVSNRDIVEILRLLTHNTESWAGGLSGNICRGSISAGSLVIVYAKDWLFAGPRYGYTVPQGLNFDEIRYCLVPGRVEDMRKEHWRVLKAVAKNTPPSIAVFENFDEKLVAGGMGGIIEMYLVRIEGCCRAEFQIKLFPPGRSDSIEVNLVVKENNLTTLPPQFFCVEVRLPGSTRNHESGAVLEDIRKSLMATKLFVVKKPTKS